MKFLKVKNAISKEVITCQSDCTIEEISKLMVEKNIRTVIIENKIGNPVGLVSGGDIVKAVAKKLPSNTTAGEIVGKELIKIDSNEDIVTAATLMNDSDIKRLAVVENEKIVGVLTSTDVLKYSPQYLQEFASTLEKLDSIIKKL